MDIQSSISPPIRPAANQRLRVENQYGETISSRMVPAGSDITAEMNREAAHWENEGWVVERDRTGMFRYPSFFMSKDEHRWFVALYPAMDGQKT